MNPTNCREQGIRLLHTDTHTSIKVHWKNSENDSIPGSLMASLAWAWASALNSYVANKNIGVKGSDQVSACPFLQNKYRVLIEKIFRRTIFEQKLWRT
jgi:hypothetical protein